MSTTPPSSLTAQQVQHVAKLSRLQLSEAELDQFARQLSKVLEHVSKLNELDVTGVEPMAHPLEMSNVMREDVEGSPLTVEQALANAPQAESPYFLVPKVIDDGGGA